MGGHVSYCIAAGLLLGQQHNWRSQPIILQGFPDHVTRMHQDGDNGFDAEFQVSNTSFIYTCCMLNHIHYRHWVTSVSERTV